MEQSGRVLEELRLDGKTLDEGYTWLAGALERRGAKLPGEGIVRSTYEIPAHATGGGGAFDGGAQAAFEELAHWFANGHDALVALAERTPGASELRCWPHHFDLGSLAAVATDSGGGLLSSIGLGLSPGDESYAEPYWYVSPWPYPEPGRLPSLGGVGHWHTEGFTSAVLTGSELLEGSPEHQSERLHGFLDTAVRVSRDLLAD